MLSGIARAASDAGAHVWAIGGPSSVSGVSNYLSLPLRIDSVWVRDYGLFCALKASFDNLSWMEWPDEDIRLRRPEALN